MSTDLGIIVRAESEAERIVREAQERQHERLADAQRLQELRLAALEPPKETAVRVREQPPNLIYLRRLAAQRKERAVARILEEFRAAA